MATNGGSAGVEREKVAPGIWRRKNAAGDPVYEITFRDSDGKQRRQTVRGGKREAIAALGKVKSEMGRGARVAPMPRLTFADAAQRWAESAARSVRPTTLDAYRSALDTHLLPAWGKRRMDTIDVNTVVTLIERMGTPEYRSEVETRVRQAKADPEVKVRPVTVTKGYGAWSVRRILVVASRIFEHARRRLGWAGENPVKGVEHNERPRHEPKARRILTGPELNAVIAAANEPHATIIATAGQLGTRLGETLGLRWKDVDFAKRVVHIERQLSRDGELVELKTKRSRRSIEMGSGLVASLQRHKLASVHTGPDDLVFVTRGGGPLEHRNVAQRGLGRAFKRANLSGRCPTFHELRHAHASAWIADGGDMVELSARLGHRDPSVTASTYMHEFDAEGRSPQRRERLDRMYAEDPAARPGVVDGPLGTRTDVREPDNVAQLEARRTSRR